MADELTWTIRHPTLPGPYFYRLRPGLWRLAAVVDGDKKEGLVAYLSGSSFLYRLKDLTGEWAGPLPFPKD